MIVIVVGCGGMFLIISLLLLSCFIAERSTKRYRENGKFLPYLICFLKIPALFSFFLVCLAHPYQYSNW